jgi:hypothetical protein
VHLISLSVLFPYIFFPRGYFLNFPSLPCHAAVHGACLGGSQRIFCFILSVGGSLSLHNNGGKLPMFVLDDPNSWSFSFLSLCYKKLAALTDSSFFFFFFLSRDWCARSSENSDQKKMYRVLSILSSSEAKNDRLVAKTTTQMSLSNCSV